MENIVFQIGNERTAEQGSLITELQKSSTQISLLTNYENKLCIEFSNHL